MRRTIMEIDNADASGIVAMYKTCTFCFGPLGDRVDRTFPHRSSIGIRRGRGRLWVVCRRCQRWNLTPLEERWEAVEECERHFRASRLRVCTDNIGVARLPDGLDLVRIGNPRRPELAAWRYGPRLRRRRLRAAVAVSGVAATGGLLIAAGAAAGVLGAVAWLALGHSGSALEYLKQRHVLVRLPHRGRPFYDLTLHDMANTAAASHTGVDFTSAGSIGIRMTDTAAPSARPLVLA